jgi:hypothetical protein
MGRRDFCQITALGVASSFVNGLTLSHAASDHSFTPREKDYQKRPTLLLNYDRPADHWNDALPIGNGRIGGMVWGKVSDEVIDLNEETLWSGHPRETNNPNAKQYLPRIRKAVFEKDYELVSRWGNSC